MNIIAIANQKGGCGKTTTAINLATELGRRDLRVLLIDMDPQGHASLGMGVDDRNLPGLYEVFSDEVSFYDIIRSDIAPCVDLIPANITLAAVEPLLTDQPGRERQLLEQLEPFNELYDYILIDCPPSVGLLSINALRAANQVLAPVETSLFALEGVTQLMQIVQLLREKYLYALPIKVLPTMFDHHTRFGQTILQQIRHQLDVGLCGVQIRHTVRAREAAYFGQSLHDYAPQATATEDYRRLAQEILETPGTDHMTRALNAALQEDIAAASAHPNHDDPTVQHPPSEDNGMKQMNDKGRRQMVVLTFDDIECRHLQLAGDFNDWIPDRDIETRNINGRWQKVFTAAPGIYEYRLLVDGKWQADPTNPSEVPNDLGGINSLLQVPVHA